MSTDKALKIKCTAEELGIIKTALEFYVRMQIGQYDIIEEHMRWIKDAVRVDNVSDQAEGLLLLARTTVFPELCHGLSGSYGVFNHKRPIEGGIAYNVYQEVRNKLAYFHHPEGGWTVDFDTPLWCDDDPCPRPEVTIQRNGDDGLAELKICQKQKDIIIDALEAYALLYSVKLREMLTYFTDDKYALDTMKCVEDIYSNLPYDEFYHAEQDTQEASELAKKIKNCN